MSGSKDGGPAFPLQALAAPNSEIAWGMSLRDWFAGHALTGMMAAFGQGAKNGGPARFHEANCDTAYDIADAMLRAREKGPQ